MDFKVFQHFRWRVYWQLGDFSPRRYAVGGSTSWGSASWEMCQIIYYHRRIFFYIFINFILGHLGLKKELNFYRLQNWKKIVRRRVKFFEPVPQLALHLTGTPPNWHFPLLTLSPTGISLKWNFPKLALPQTGTSGNFAGTPRWSEEMERAIWVLND